MDPRKWTPKKRERRKGRRKRTIITLIKLRNTSLTVRNLIHRIVAPTDTRQLRIVISRIADVADAEGGGADGAAL